MRTLRFVASGVVCFAIGAMVQAGFAQAKKPVFTADMITGKTPKEAAAALLDGALSLAETGSWERIAVGRAWYLGGDKAKGQQMFDAVTGDKKVAGSDWFRVARVYVEANEWAKAKAAFEKGLEINPNDDSGMVEYGGMANLNHDRAKAEELFNKGLNLKKKSDFWNWVNAGGSYLGVRPQ